MLYETVGRDNMIYELGARLKELRENKNLSQKELGKLVGVSHNSISLYESGDRQPSIDLIVRFAALYKVSTDYILGLTRIKSLDTSRLDEEDFMVINKLVEIMSSKNDQIVKNR